MARNGRIPQGLDEALRYHRGVSLAMRHLLETYDRQRRDLVDQIAALGKRLRELDESHERAPASLERARAKIEELKAIEARRSAVALGSLLRPKMGEAAKDRKLERLAKLRSRIARLEADVAADEVAHEEETSELEADVEREEASE